MIEMKYVVISGAGSGLGLELVKEHIKGDYRIFALDVHLSEPLLAVTKEAESKVTLLQCDIGSTESVEAAMDVVKAETSVVHRVFNNAGIHRFKDWVNLDETEVDFIATMYNINAVGSLRIVKALLPVINQETVLIYTSSEAASLSNQTATIGYAYAMSKAGMNMGSRITDNWLKDKGVRTIMIHPGRMRTAMRGDHSNIDPWETSGKLMELVENLKNIPGDQLFMDYKGNPMDW